MSEVKAKAGLKPGVNILIGGVTYVAPPLNFGALRAMKVEVKAGPTYIDDLLAFVLLRSLERNYEGINALWLNDTLEGHEIEDVSVAMVKILEASGLKMQNASSGEVKAAA